MSITPSSAVFVKNKVLWEVNLFMHLGSILVREGKTEAGVKTRTGKARLAWKATNTSCRQSLGSLVQM